MRIAIFALSCCLAAGSAWAEEKPSEARRLLAEGDRLFSGRDYAGATKHYQEAIALAEKAGDASALVEALSMTARGHLIQKKKEEGRGFLTRAGELASEEDPAGWSRYLGVRGRYEWRDDEKPKATKTFEAMYAYCLEHELWNRAVDAAHMVAIVGTHDQQLEWAQKGIAAAEKGEMDGWLGPLWNNLGNTYDELGRHQDALDAWKKARHYHWKVGGEKSKLVADWAVGLGYRKVGAFDKALQWQRPVLAWAERRLAEKDDPERREWVALAKMELGLIAVHEKRTEEAAGLLKAAHAVLAAAGMQSWHPAAWKELEGGLARACPRELVGIHLQSFEDAINQYRMVHKKLPGSLQDLTESDGRMPKPPLPAVPEDAWGNPYEYKALDRSSYRLRSLGPDGLPETADDITQTS